MTGHAALALGICSTVVYIVSAFASFVTSYDQWAGREKLTLMLLGLLLPLTLAVLVRRRIETVIGILGVLLAIAAPLIGVAGLTVAAIDRGAAAGNLAILIPLAGCGIVWAMARQNRVLLVVLGVCLAVAAGTVLISGESSAVLGLIVGPLIGFGAFWRYRLAAPSRWLTVLDLAVSTLGLLFVAVYLMLILAPDRMGQIGQMLPSYYEQRFAAWRDTPGIISDYAFTGSGLGAAAMVLSSYLFLVHVPYFYHVHNLFLQVGIEQGLPGMIGLTGMFVAGFWSMAIAMRRAHAYVALCAASVFSSLLALFVSGLFESDVYAGNWVVVMFLAFGFAWVIAQYDVSGRAIRRGAPSRPQLVDVAIGLLPFVMVGLLFVWPGAHVRWQVNQAALAQTKSELAGFRFPLTLIQDEMRRDPRIRLDPAIAQYREVLAQDPQNASALRRLAQIKISRGDYAGALQNLERAYKAAPGQRATRQMLGEMYAVEGRIDEATALWATIGVAPELLKNRLWWYEHIGEKHSASNIQTVLDQLGI
jgi:O-antigen ligase